MLLTQELEEVLEQQSGGDRAQEPARVICCGAIETKNGDSG